MKNKILILFCFLFYQVSTSAQEITLKGNVVDAETGFSIAGANVIEKGTTKGTMTDFDGAFTLLVNSNATLEISYIGYTTQTIVLDGKTQIEIKLQPEVSQLEEVIVVGYGTQKKSDLTGSVVRANIEDFQDQPNVSITQSLQGAVAGLNVGAVTAAGQDPGFSVRGRNTFARDDRGNLVNNSPLIVLDGVIYRGNLVDLNPNDIESIDILKDASSQAIYGSQAANGVILVTSKGGKKGRKPVYNFSTYYSAQTPLRQFTPLNRQQYIDRISDIFWEDAFLAPEYTQRNPDFDPVGALTEPRFTDVFSEGYDTNWLDLVTQNAFISNVNLSMSGSTEKTSYFISMGYTDQQTFVKNDAFDRINLRMNFDSDIKDWLRVGIQTFMTSSDFSGASASLRGGYITPPIVPTRNEDGSLNLLPSSNDLTPIASLEVDDLEKRLNLFGNIYAQIDVPFIKGLSYRVNYSTNRRDVRAYNFNPFSNNENGRARKYNSFTIDQTLDNLLTYKKTINDVHDIDVTLLSGKETRIGDDTDAIGNFFPNDVLGYNGLENGEVDRREIASGAFDEASIYQMGRLNYRYNNKYLATFTVRRDGFSGFGTNKKFGIFPSGSIAWTASNENFIKESASWINNLKFRMSYGKNGNRTVGRYNTLARVGTGNDYVFGDGGTSAFAQRITKLANDDLGWEATTGINLGLDFGFFGNRLSGNIEYYNTTTEDILFNQPIPQITGFSSIFSSIGEVANEGLEVTLNTVNVKTEDFKWSSRVVFSTNRNEVVSVFGRDDDGDGIEDDLITSSLFIGESIGTIYGYVVDGIYQIGDTDIPDGLNPGNYRIVDLDGEDGITLGGDRTILGRTEPAYRISLFNEFNYKNFSLSVFINSVQGGKDGYLGSINPKRNGEFGWQPDTVENFNTVAELDYWTPSNPNARYSGLRYDDIPDPGIFKDRSFIRLQDVNLAYTLPKTVLDKLQISALRLFVSGKNLYTWTDWDGLDPETGAGFSLGSFPVMKSVTLGMNLTF